MKQCRYGKGRTLDRYFQQETTSAALLLQRIDINRVVVFRALQLGDMLCAVPAWRALRAALPNAHIALVGLPWAQQFAERFRNYIDAFHPFPGHHAFPEQPVREGELDGFYRNMQAQKYSLALQLHGSGEISNGIAKQFGAQLQAGYVTPGSNEEDGDCYFPYPENGPESLRLLKLMQLLGAPDGDAHLEFPLLQEDWDELNKSGKTAGLLPDRYICIHPGARFRDKCWPPQCFAETADKLSREFGLQVVLTGSHKEADLTAAVARYMKTPAIDTASPLSIGAMAALMSGARLLVCNDTGVSHIAAGLGLKSVVIFNKADIDRWAPSDHRLHRCLWDPKGERVDEVLTQARLLLTDAN
jgi:ADP-heptose:LPS heptosyltransferase